MIDFLEMLRDYKEKGERVDEVIYQSFCDFLTISREKWTDAESRAFQKTMQLGLVKSENEQLHEEIKTLQRERDAWKKEAESWKLPD